MKFPQYPALRPPKQYSNHLAHAGGGGGGGWSPGGCTRKLAKPNTFQGSKWCLPEEEAHPQEVEAGAEYHQSHST